MSWLILTKDRDDAKRWGIKKYGLAIDMENNVVNFSRDDLKKLEKQQHAFALVVWDGSKLDVLDRLFAQFCELLSAKARYIWVHFGYENNTPTANTIATKWVDQYVGYKFFDYCENNNILPLSYSQTREETWDTFIKELTIGINKKSLSTNWANDMKRHVEGAISFAGGKEEIAKAISASLPESLLRELFPFVVYCNGHLCSKDTEEKPFLDELVNEHNTILDHVGSISNGNESIDKLTRILNELDSNDLVTKCEEFCSAYVKAAKTIYK